MHSDGVVKKGRGPAQYGCGKVLNLGCRVKLRSGLLINCYVCYESWLLVGEMQALNVLQAKHTC